MYPLSLSSVEHDSLELLISGKSVIGASESGVEASALGIECMEDIEQALSSLHSLSCLLLWNADRRALMDSFVRAWIHRICSLDEDALTKTDFSPDVSSIRKSFRVYFAAPIDGYL